MSMGRNYTGTLVSEQPYPRPGMYNPRMFWVPSISPSSIVFYTGDKFPRWKNQLFVGALNGKQLQRVAFNQPSQAERREPLLTQLNVRIRDVQQGPDGYLYVATEVGSGGTAPTERYCGLSRRTDAEPDRRGSRTEVWAHHSFARSSTATSRYN